MKNLLTVLLFVFTFSNCFSQKDNSSQIIVSHLQNDGFMDFKFGDKIDNIKSKIESMEGVEFVKRISGGLFYSGGRIDGEIVETWELFFANNKFAGLRICFIDRKLFSKVEVSLKAKFGNYTDKQEVGPVIYISENGKKMHDTILSWQLPKNLIEFEEKVDGIGAFQTKVYLTYANIALVSRM